MNYPAGEMRIIGEGLFQRSAASEASQIDQATEQMRCGLLVYDNFTVYALAGNANNENLQEDIRHIKGEARGIKQPVGWTRPFDERTLAAIDISAIEDRRLQGLLRDPHELTARIGALSFIRAGADLEWKEKESIPDCIIPPDGATVQLYSPVGAKPTERLISAAIKKGIEPVMTSANVSGQPEITTGTDAIDFAAQSSSPLVVAINRSDEDKSDRPLGSYPVICVEEDRLKIVRPGCFAPEILQAALNDFPVELAADFQTPNYPANVLGFSDLPTDLQDMKGTEFRLGLLAHLGWSA